MQRLTRGSFEEEGSDFLGRIGEAEALAVNFKLRVVPEWNGRWGGSAWTGKDLAAINRHSVQTENGKESLENGEKDIN